MALLRFPAESSLASRETNEQIMERDEGSTSRAETKAISLPDELVEKILSMIPFPNILKARLLNNSWSSKFEAIPEAIPFQKQVKAVSSRWKHYCPIIFNIENDRIVGYDRESKLWRSILQFRFESESLWKSLIYTRKVGAGSLLCALHCKSNSVFVINVVTKDWRRLPSGPDLGRWFNVHLLPIGSDAYQVLLTTVMEGNYKVSCQLYDSRMESWTTQQSALPAAFDSSVYLDGVLYAMGQTNHELNIQSYNVGDGIWTNIRRPFDTIFDVIETYRLLVCHNHVMVVVHFRPPGWNTNIRNRTRENIAVVYKLDPVSLDVTEVVRRPLGLTSPCSLIVSDNESIYFANPHIVGTSFVEYNLQSNEWTEHPPPPRDDDLKTPWSAFPLRPGLNPFVSV